MAYEQITYERRGKAGIVTLNRPERLNAYTPRMLNEAREAIEEAVAHPEVAAIVITGAGRAFCAGADIGDVFAKNVERREAGDEDAQPGDARQTDWVSFLRTLPKPTIAAVNGAAVGIGVTMTLPMDIRIAADNARFGMFFVRMGLVPELASSALLPQMVGLSRAIEWCFTARMVGAEEAREAGLVSAVVPGEQLLDKALEIVDQVARNPAPALAATRKLLIDNINNDDIPAVQRSEGAALGQAYRTWEHKEAVAAFLEKREPNYTKKPVGA